MILFNYLFNQKYYICSIKIKGVYMNIKVKSVLAVICVAFAIGASEAKTIRATEMDRSLWSRFSQGTLSDIVIEFRHGDCRISSN